jgi:multisubunit Na+/H+ antiporter MnhF subunit
MPTCSRIFSFAAIAFDERSLLQPALVLALIAFLGTVSFAYYYEKGLKK